MRTERAIELARELFAAALGRVFEVWELDGYIGNDSIMLVAQDEPFVVRVVHTSDDDVTRHDYEWLDPYWNVELVEPHWDAVVGGELVRSTWIYGPSAYVQEEHRP